MRDRDEVEHVSIGTRRELAELLGHYLSLPIFVIILSIVLIGFLLLRTAPDSSRIYLLAVLAPTVLVFAALQFSTVYASEYMEGRLRRSEQFTASVTDALAGDYDRRHRGITHLIDLAGSHRSSEALTMALIAYLQSAPPLLANADQRYQRFLSDTGEVRSLLVVRLQRRPKGAPPLEANDIDLTDADLSDVHLADSNLAHTQFAGAILRGADLANTVLTGANLRRAYIANADLRGANLQGADLESATLVEADLRGANLIGANLRRTTLVGARLEGAVIEDVKLDETDVRGTDLSTVRGSITWRSSELVTDENTWIRAER